jgi:HSP20 family protein
MGAKSFFEKLTGGLINDEEKEDNEEENENKDEPEKNSWISEEEGQLAIDVYQTPNQIIIKTMVAGVEPEDLDINLNQDMLTIKGKRETGHEISEENYFYKELYWGKFSRSILLPQEVDTDKAEASLKNGLLVIKLPKVDKERIKKIKIKAD